jgi:hypothetical protein
MTTCCRLRLGYGAQEGQEEGGGWQGQSGSVGGGAEHGSRFFGGGTLCCFPGRNKQRDGVAIRVARTVVVRLLVEVGHDWRGRRRTLYVCHRLFHSTDLIIGTVQAVVAATACSSEGEGVASATTWVVAEVVRLPAGAWRRAVDVEA